MKRWCIFLLSLGCLAVAKTPQLPTLDDFVVTEKMAYAVLPPEAIGTSGIRHIEWSPTGRFLLMVQEKPKLNPAQVVDALLDRAKPEVTRNLVVYDTQSRKLQDYGPIELLIESYGPEFWNGASREAGPLFMWFAGVDVAAIESTSPTGDGFGAGLTDRVALPTAPPAATIAPGSPLPVPQAADRVVLKRLDLVRAVVEKQMIRSVGLPLSSPELTPSPASPQMVAVEVVPESDRPGARLTTYVWVLDSRGRESTPVPIGEGAAHLSNFVGDGSLALFELRTRDGAGAILRKQILFDINAGKLVSTTPIPKPFEPPSASRPIEIRMTPSETSAGVVKVGHMASWLSAVGASESPASLLGADLEQAELSPNLSMVATLHKGIASIRPIAAMNRAVWEEVYRKQVMDGAKQVALGLLMYAADYDDLLPESGHFAEGAVGPYMKNEGWLRKFSFRLGGNNLGKLGNPSETALGHILGIGGYAVAFADGHVEWKPGRP